MKYFDIIPIDKIEKSRIYILNVYDEKIIEDLRENPNNYLHSWIFRPIDVTRYSERGLRTQTPPFKYELNDGKRRLAIHEAIGFTHIRARIETTFSDDKELCMHFPENWLELLGGNIKVKIEKSEELITEKPIEVEKPIEIEIPIEKLVEPKEEIRPVLTTYPTVLIVTPTKDDAHYIERHCKAWENIDYPKDKIRWIWIYGESGDNTLSLLENYFSKGKWRCEIYAEPKFNNITGNAMWIADVINAARNIYKGEDFVVLCDSDIVKIQSSLLKELIALNLDIVAPYVWHDGREKDFFDTYVFRELDGTRYPVNNVPHMESKQPVELASVGTMIVMKGEVFKLVKFENPCPNLQFCKNARKKDYKVWTVPWLNILHADVGKEGRRENHSAPEDFIKKGILPKFILEKLR